MSLSFYFETRERKSCICIGSDFGASESTCWLHCVALMLRLLCGFSLLHPCYSGGRSVLLTTQKPYLTAGTQWRSTARLIAARRMDSPAQWQRICGCLCRIPTTTGRMDNPTSALSYHLLFRMIRAPLPAWCGRRAERERGFSSWTSTER